MTPSEEVPCASSLVMKFDDTHPELHRIVLDADLNIVRGKEEERREEDGGRMSRRRYVDVVIDLNQHLFDVRWSPR
jgi:hypothetical protein